MFSTAGKLIFIVLDYFDSQLIFKFSSRLLITSPLLSVLSFFNQLIYFFYHLHSPHGEPKDFIARSGLVKVRYFLSITLFIIATTISSALLSLKLLNIAESQTSVLTFLFSTYT